MKYTIHERTEMVELLKGAHYVDKADFPSSVVEKGSAAELLLCAFFETAAGVEVDFKLQHSDDGTTFEDFKGGENGGGYWHESQSGNSSMVPLSGIPILGRANIEGAKPYLRLLMKSKGTAIGYVVGVLQGEQYLPVPIREFGPVDAGIPYLFWNIK